MLIENAEEWEWLGEYSEEEDAGDEADDEDEGEPGADDEEDEVPHIPKTMAAFISAAKAARTNEVSQSPRPWKQGLFIEFHHSTALLMISL